MEKKQKTENIKLLLKIKSQCETSLIHMLQILGEHRDSEFFRKAISPSIDYYAQMVQTYSDILLKEVESSLTEEKTEEVKAKETLTKSLKKKSND